jgi:hypothetical protein
LYSVTTQNLVQWKYRSVSAPAEDALGVKDGHYGGSRTTLILHYYRSSRCKIFFFLSHVSKSETPTPNRSESALDPCFIFPIDRRWADSPNLIQPRPRLLFRSHVGQRTQDKSQGRVARRSMLFWYSRMMMAGPPPQRLSNQSKYYMENILKVRKVSSYSHRRYCVLPMQADIVRPPLLCTA